jgi:tetratricopeptide (TPR) repeat protein
MVTDVTRRTGKLKKEIAREWGMRPDRLSHLLNGQRQPARDEVLRIAGGLRLEEGETNRLLDAAGFGPISRQQVQHSSAASLVSRLSDPERAVALAEAERDEEVIKQAWHHYTSVRTYNQKRDWHDASRLNKLGEDYYWAIRAVAVRFRAQMCLADATSLQYLNRLSEAEAKCTEGLVWADDAASERFRVMLLSRLASIKRLQSDYEEADCRHEEALGVLDAWQEADAGGEPELSARQAFRDHWRARIQRMQGLVELFKGRPVEAVERLRPALEHFTGGTHHDELAQALCALGWASSLRGEFEEAIYWNRKGLDAARQHIERSGREDDRLLLQGHLDLGNNYLDMNELEQARAELEVAYELAQRRQLAHFSSVGSVYRLLGKLEMREGNWQRAHVHLGAALDFYSSHEERVLLATGHNAMGDFYLAQDAAVNRQRALDHYQRALEAARSSRPPNTYYECASLLNICRARVRTRFSQVAPSERPSAAVSEAERDFEALMDEVKQLGQIHRYRNHLARLAVVQVEHALNQGDVARADSAATEAMHLAGNFSKLAEAEVRDALKGLGIAADLLAMPLATVHEG